MLLVAYQSYLSAAAFQAAAMMLQLWSMNSCAPNIGHANIGPSIPAAL
jgi:hypothetical protein